MLKLFSFCITDLNDVLNSDGTYPVIQVLATATGSQAGTLVLGSILIILVFFSTVTTIASASRQAWAFSRDRVSIIVRWAYDRILTVNRASLSRHGSAMSRQRGRFL